MIDTKKKILLSFMILGFSTNIFADDLSAWTSETNSNTLSQQGCNPVIAKQISDSQSAVINGQQTMARNLFQDILGNMSYSAASCLQNLLPNLSTGSFTLPVSQITSAISNAACSYAQKTLGAVINDESSLVSRGESMLTNTIKIPGVDGLNFGTILSFNNKSINAGNYLSSQYQQEIPNWNYQTNSSQVINQLGNSLGIPNVTNYATTSKRYGF